MEKMPKEKRFLLSFLSLSFFNLFIFVILISPAQAKKRCKPLLEKLNSVQAMQRSGYSLKRGQSLRAKEDKARDKWWQCENNSRYAKTNKKTRKKSSKNIAKKLENNKRKYKPVKPYKANQDGFSPFADSGPIVIKSKFQGEKKFAWLSFYQQPLKCKRPKNLSVFANCSEDKQTQQLQFEKQYKE